METKPISQQWDVWKDLPVEELERRRKVLFRREESLTIREKMLEAEKNEAFADRQKAKAKLVLLERTIDQMAMIRVLKPIEVIDVLRSEFLFLLSLETSEGMRGGGPLVPVFSEASLYPRFGKDLARTILGRLRSLGTGFGISDEDLREKGV